MRTGIGAGLVGGIVGLGVMELIRRITAPLVSQRAPKPTDVFASERSMSPLGPHHEPGESATDAIGRLAYEKVTGDAPSRAAKEKLSWLVHVGYGLIVASAYGAIRAGRGRTVRDGLVFGAGLWLFGDELAVPLLGLADKPSAYSSTRHAQSLAQHLGFGVATAATAHLMEAFR